MNVFLHTLSGIPPRHISRSGKHPKTYDLPASRPDLCSICEQQLSGRVWVNAWGEPFCKRHTRQYIPCFNCHRLISPALTGGGVRYNENTAVCMICRSTALDHRQAAVPVFNRVRAHLQWMGFDFGGTTIPLHLVDWDLGTTHSGKHLGQAYLTSRSLDGNIQDRGVEKIEIRRGLPHR